VVSREGNRKAQEIIRQVFVPADAAWRGIGVIPESGLVIAPGFREYDAVAMIPVEVDEPVEHPGCRCGDILRGKVSPFDCPLFGGACTPESPVGACMVSSEGTCAAAYKYGR